MARALAEVLAGSGALAAWYDDLLERETAGDRAAAGSYLASFLLSGLVEVAVAALIGQQRGLVLDPHAVALHRHADGWVDGLALRDPRVRVLPDDPVAGSHDAVVVDDPAALRRGVAAELAAIALPAFTAVRALAPFGVVGMAGNFADAAAWAGVEHAGARGVAAAWAEVDALLDELRLAGLAFRARPRLDCAVWEGTRRSFVIKSACCLYFRTIEGTPDRRGEGYCTSCPCATTPGAASAGRSGWPRAPVVDVAAPPTATVARRRPWLERLEQRGLLRGGGWRLAALLGGLALLALVVLLSLGYGSRPIPLREVVQALTDYDGSNDHLIVVSLRVPRTLIGLGVGVALGLAGAVMQGVTRNPLADPGHPRRRTPAPRFAVVLGDLRASASAACSATSGSRSPAPRSPRSSSTRSGRWAASGATPVKLALAGAAITALLGSITDGDPAARRRHARPVPLLGGRLAGRPGRDASLRQVAAVHRRRRRCSRSASARPLNALALGDDVARSLGQRVALARALRGGRGGAAGRRRGRGGRADRASSASRPARRPGHHRPRLPLGPALLGGARRRSCCSAPTSSAASSPGPASSRSASSPRSSARRSSSRSCAAASWPSCDRTLAGAVTERSPIGGRVRSLDAAAPVGRVPTVGRRSSLARRPRSSCSAWSRQRRRLPDPARRRRRRAASAAATRTPTSSSATLRLPAGAHRRARRRRVRVLGRDLPALARNPLASPDIIGVTAGAGRRGRVRDRGRRRGSCATVALGALVGALLTAVADLPAGLQAAACRRYRLVLVGIGVGAVLTASPPTC